MYIYTVPSPEGWVSNCYQYNWLFDTSSHPFLSKVHTLDAIHCTVYLLYMSFCILYGACCWPKLEHFTPGKQCDIQVREGLSRASAGTEGLAPLAKGLTRALVSRGRYFEKIEVWSSGYGLSQGWLSSNRVHSLNSQDRLRTREQRREWEGV